MTVYEELWNSPSFIDKRIKEQSQYILELKTRDLSHERYQLLFWSASFVFWRLIQQSKHLKQNEQ